MYDQFYFSLKIFHFMKDTLIIENVEYYNFNDIRKWLFKDLNNEEIQDLFQSNKLKGKLIDNSWFCSSEDLEKYFKEYENQNYHLVFSEVKLNSKNFEGRILDIGGGGEGIIGQLKGDQVVSIDKNKGELLEAMDAGDLKSLKINMDATNLLFLDNSFYTITAFFSLMYMNPKVHKLVFKEIHRILRDEGTFVIWDPIIPINPSQTDVFYIIFLEITLNDQNLIHTGYGTNWNKHQDLMYYINLGKEVGFKVIHKEILGNYFCLNLSK